METLAMRIVFDQKGKAKKDKKKKAMIHIEVRDIVTNQKTYIPTNVKILFEHYTKDGTIISSKHPNAAILRKNVQSIFHKIEAFVLSDKCKTFSDVQNWNKEDDLLTMSVKDFIVEYLKYSKASESVWEHAKSFFTRLDEFGKIKTFKDVTFDNIEDLDNHLRKTINSQPVLYKRHNFFKNTSKEQ